MVGGVVCSFALLLFARSNKWLKNLPYIPARLSLYFGGYERRHGCRKRDLREISRWGAAGGALFIALPRAGEPEPKSRRREAPQARGCQGKRNRPSGGKRSSEGSLAPRSTGTSRRGAALLPLHEQQIQEMPMAKKEKMLEDLFHETLKDIYSYCVTNFRICSEPRSMGNAIASW